MPIINNLLQWVDCSPNYNNITEGPYNVTEEYNFTKNCPFTQGEEGYGALVLDIFKNKEASYAECWTSQHKVRSCHAENIDRLVVFVFLCSTM